VEASHPLKVAELEQQRDLALRAHNSAAAELEQFKDDCTTEQRWAILRTCLELVAHNEEDEDGMSKMKLSMSPRRTGTEPEGQKM